MDCPHCHRLLYSRSHRKCGFCGGELPPEVLFTEAEIAAIKQEQRNIEMRRAISKAQEEERLEEERRNNSSDGGFGDGGF